MIYIDKFAYLNRLRNVHPAEKTGYALLTLLIVLAIPSQVMQLAAFVFTSAILVGVAGIPFRFYIKMLLIPLYFTLAACLPIVFEYPAGDLSVDFIRHGLGINPAGLRAGTEVFIRSLAAISSMYFLALTVPVADIIYILKKIKMPLFLLDLIFLIYRFLLVMLETSDRIHTAQVCRLSENSFQARIGAAAKTAGALFVLSIKKYEEIVRAMESRLYNGEIVFFTTEYHFSGLNILGIVIVISLLSFIGLYGEPILLKGVNFETCLVP